MKWVKLIGGRFLDFLITSAVVTLLCVGVVLIGEHYGRIKPLSPEELSPEAMRQLQQKYLTPERIREIESKYMPVESTLRTPEVGRAHGMTAEEAEAIRRKYAPVESRLPDEQGGISRLTTPRAIRNGTLVLSIALGLFGVISIFGIVFRRGGLTQREGFVRVWVGVPKYLGGYFAGYFRKSNTKGE